MVYLGFATFEYLVSFFLDLGHFLRQVVHIVEHVLRNLCFSSELGRMLQVVKMEDLLTFFILDIVQL